MGNKQVAVDVLQGIDPKVPYGTGLFNALARLTVSVAVETVFGRRSESGGWEVLLSVRGPDEAYAGQWHSPGSVMRPGEAILDVMRRIVSKEHIMSPDDLPKPAFRGFFNNPYEERGHFLQMIFLLEVAPGVQMRIDPEQSAWFSLDDLPKNTVAHHVDVLVPAAFGLPCRRDDDVILVPSSVSASVLLLINRDI